MRAHIIWTEPVADLVTSLRSDAKDQREWGNDALAKQLERIADRVEDAIEAGSRDPWIPLSQAAALEGKVPETLRLRCRKHLAAKGLAKKERGDWRIHSSAIAA